MIKMRRLRYYVNWGGYAREQFEGIVTRLDQIGSQLRNIENDLRVIENKIDRIS